MGLCLIGQSHAADIQKIEIQYEDNTYSISFRAILSADTNTVEHIVTNHANLKTLSSRVTESEVLSGIDDENVKLKLVLRPCVLFYCKTLTKTSDVEVTHNLGTSISYIADPEHSSFRIANELLTIPKNGERTQLNYTATIVPGFRVPPVIGPWLVKRVLRKELIEVGENVEKQASGEFRNTQ
ncbi:MAG: hypothetical protein OER96_05065 [Gammaproteobacteria bacterium]|nr:hypothetical protein [Gammaproteobacteria bacterium]